MKIVFMGSPEFAVCSLEKLRENGHEILLAVTGPDRPAGRGMQPKQSAVKEYCNKTGIPVLQPEKLRDSEFIETLKKLQADVFVVIAFRMLPETVWSIPPRGTINIHASLLPDYRGAAPINHAIMNGEKESGVSSFLIGKEIDTGDILLKKKCLIEENETAGSLHDKLKHLGANLLIETLKAIENGNVQATAQNNLPASQKNAPKLTTQNTRVDFAKTAHEIDQFCRGLNPFPGAWCEILIQGEKQLLKVFRTKKSPEDFTGCWDAEGPVKKCKDGWIIITELQPQGKRRMLGKEYAAGLKSRGIEIEII